MGMLPYGFYEYLETRSWNESRGSSMRVLCFRNREIEYEPEKTNSHRNDDQVYEKFSHSVSKN